MTYMMIMSRNGQGEAYLAQFKTIVDGEKQKKTTKKNNGQKVISDRNGASDCCSGLEQHSLGTAFGNSCLLVRVLYVRLVRGVQEGSIKRSE